jgi:hypothetical protein
MANFQTVRRATTAADPTVSDAKIGRAQQSRAATWPPQVCPWVTVYYRLPLEQKVGTSDIFVAIVTCDLWK